MDAGVYPIARWGAQHAAMGGAAVRVFPHHDAAALRRELAAAPRGRAPMIVTDGFCANCGHVAPLGEYLELARHWGGWLVADDTQALGVLGHSPNARRPYGHGGGGSLRWSGVSGPDVLVFNSLAKGFGVPMAVLAGSNARVRQFEERSLTRVHCSPPSAAAFRAAQHAIELNRSWGDALRRRLAHLVRSFREGLRGLGISARGGGFPIQTLVLPPRVDAELLHRDLEERGLRTVLQAGRNDARPRLTLLLTARQPRSAIKLAVAMIAQALGGRQRTSMTAVHSQQKHRTLQTASTRTYE